MIKIKKVLDTGKDVKIKLKEGGSSKTFWIRREVPFRDELRKSTIEVLKAILPPLGFEEPKEVAYKRQFVTTYGSYILRLIVNDSCLVTRPLQDNKLLKLYPSLKDYDWSLSFWYLGNGSFKLINHNIAGQEPEVEAWFKEYFNPLFLETYKRKLSRPEIENLIKRSEEERLVKEVEVKGLEEAPPKEEAHPPAPMPIISEVGEGPKDLEQMQPQPKLEAEALAPPEPMKVQEREVSIEEMRRRIQEYPFAKDFVKQAAYLRYQEALLRSKKASEERLTKLLYELIEGHIKPDQYYRQLYFLAPELRS